MPCVTSYYPAISSPGVFEEEKFSAQRELIKTSASSKIMLLRRLIKELFGPTGTAVCQTV